MSCKVFITNVNGHDYSKAEEIGELVAVTIGIQPVFRFEKIVERIKTVLKDFDTDDFLLLSGPNIVNIIAVTYLFTKTTAIKVLMHNAKEDVYVQKTLNKSLVYDEEV